MLAPRIKAHGRAFAHIAAFHPELTALRRDLHAHPEIGFEEHHTVKRVVESLKVCGVDEIHTGIGKTGVVALIHGQTRGSGHMMGLRADMDALPITEQNDFAWKSTRTGLMHGCGHDGHIAMLVGAARYLAETRQFDGTAVLIFQPGEEGFAGAKAMIEDKDVIPSRAYRPTVVLVSDGGPNDAWENPLDAFIGDGRSAKCDRMAMAIGADADEAVLGKFIQGTPNKLFYAENSKQLRDFFKFVTMSVTIRTKSQTPNIVPEASAIDVQPATIDARKEKPHSSSAEDGGYW